MLTFQVIIKEPLKLTLKAFSKNTAPIAPHPPLKLTLPKPATYPYSTNAISAKINSSTEVDSAVLSENKLIRRSIDNHVKLKEEEDDMKLSVFGEQTTGFLKSGTVVRFKLGLVTDHVVCNKWLCVATCYLKVEDVIHDGKIGT